MGLIPSVISLMLLKQWEKKLNIYFYFCSNFFRGCKNRNDKFSVENEELENTVEKIILNILQGGPESIKSAKNLIYYVEDKEIDEKVMNETAKRIAYSRASAEGKECISAFLNKRKPDWQE